VKKVILAALLAMIAALAAQAGPAHRAEGIERKDYRWNVPTGEKLEALKLKGDRKRGEEAYGVCVGCHLPSGAGRPDGTFPQLAGQHRTVLLKQMADIRAGLRDNPTMYPFAVTLTDAQELADVAAYIELLTSSSFVSRGNTAGTRARMPTDRWQSAEHSTKRSARIATGPAGRGSRKSSTR